MLPSSELAAHCGAAKVHQAHSRLACFHSVSMHGMLQVRSHQMAIAAGDASVRIFDRRKLSAGACRPFNMLSLACCLLCIGADPGLAAHQLLSFTSAYRLYRQRWQVQRRSTLVWHSMALLC